MLSLTIPASILIAVYGKHNKFLRYASVFPILALFIFMMMVTDFGQVKVDNPSPHHLSFVFVMIYTHVIALWAWIVCHLIGLLRAQRASN